MVSIQRLIHNHNDWLLTSKALDEGACTTGCDDKSSFVKEEVELFGKRDEGDSFVGKGRFKALAVLDDDFGKF